MLHVAVWGQCANVQQARRPPRCRNTLLLRAQTATCYIGLAQLRQSCYYTLFPPPHARLRMRRTAPSPAPCVTARAHRGPLQQRAGSVQFLYTAGRCVRNLYGVPKRGQREGCCTETAQCKEIVRLYGSAYGLQTSNLRFAECKGWRGECKETVQWRWKW